MMQRCCCKSIGTYATQRAKAGSELSWQKAGEPNFYSFGVSTDDLLAYRKKQWGNLCRFDLESMLGEAQ